MKGRMGVLIFSVALFMLCIQLPVIFVEQISGLWDVMEKAMADYMALFSNFSYAGLNDWAQAYSGKIGFSFASFVFMLLVPGPLTLGLSRIWLNVLRGKEAYADMIFSGFSEFIRVVSMDTFRRILMILWAILLIIPGIIAWYRYSQAFFLVADNPKMGPFETIALSKHYMEQNKAPRFLLDLSFIGWFALSVVVFYAIDGGVTAVLLSAGAEPSAFVQMLVSAIVNSVVFAPVFAYRGVASADFYHRVICRDPGSFRDPPALTSL